MRKKLPKNWRVAAAAFFLSALTGVASPQGAPHPADSELFKEIRLQLWDWRQLVELGKGSSRAFAKAELGAGAIDLQTRALLFDESVALCREDHDQLGEGSILALRAMMGTAPSDMSTRLVFGSQGLAILKSVGRPQLCYSLAIGLSEDMTSAGRYQEALELATYAGSVSSDDHVHRAISCLFRSGCLLSLGRFSESEAALAEAPEVGLDDSIKARLLFGKATLKSRTGQWRESSQLLEHAISLVGPQDRLAKARSQVELGTVYVQLGQAERAVELLRESVETQRNLGVPAAALGHALFALGQAESLTGQFEPAMAHLRETTELFRKQKLPLQMAYTLSLLAHVEATLGRPGEAIKDCQECQQILCSPGLEADGRKLRASVWHQIAPLYWNAGKFDDSVNAYRMAVTEMFPGGSAPPQLLSEVEQALTFWRKGEYRDALTHYENILDLMSQASNEQDMISWWLDLAGTYQNSGDTEGAVRSLSRAQSISDKHNIFYGQMDSEIALAQVKLRQGDKASAVRIGESALVKARRASQRLYVAKALKILTDAGHPDSVKYAAEALTLINGLQREAFYGGGEASAVGFSILSSRVAKGGATAALASGDIDRALELLELGRGKLTEVARIRNRVASVDPAGRQLLAKLQDLYSRVGGEPGLRAEAETVEAELARHTRSFLPEASFKIADVQKQLTDDMAVVVYAEVGTEVRAFVLDRNKVQSVPLALEGWAFPQAGWTPKALGNASDRLWKPLEGLISGRKQLFLVTEGTLGSVPWEALGQTPMIETHEVAYADGLTDLIRPASKSRSGTFILGGLDYGNGAEWSRLPASSAEAASIAKIWRGHALTGKEAQKTAVMQAMTSAGCLHFATHAFAPPQIDTKTPEHGFLKLIPNMKNIAPDAAQAVADLAKTGLVLSDGQVLNGLEILGLDLSGTRLVVLSACDTRKGQNIAGEGIYDLRRAFLAAGASSVVSTLWSVDDAATSRLMVLFHQRLKAGDSPAKALCSAKRQLIRDGEPVQNWAAFVLHQQGVR